MLGNICNRNILVRLICVLMLALIQFDVFGYDFMYASCQSEIKSCSYSLDDSQTVSESQTIDSEWSDPIYKHGSRRPFSDIIAMPSSVLLFLPIVYRICDYGNTISGNIMLYEEQSYLRFRALLI